MKPKPKMKMNLKRNERVFINGAVLVVDQKVTISILNDAQYLLERHVMQVSDATTPMRQLYFLIQALLINPLEAHNAIGVYRDLYASLITTYTDESVKEGLQEADKLVEAGRMFEALKIVRGMFDADGEAPGVMSVVTSAHAAA